MAPASITEDYYMVLEVEQTATEEQIIQSYRRLALKLHPDRNTKHDATKAFQLLGEAYETLKDKSKRQAYNLNYPSVRGRSTKTPYPASASTPRSGVLSETAQIAALQKSKQDREARWWTKKTTFDSSIFELQRDIRRLEQEIHNLNSIVAAEMAEEAQKNSWGTWLLSPIYKKTEDSEEEKARKERQVQERRIEKDMKERRLAVKNAEKKKQEILFQTAKGEWHAADSVDDAKIRKLKANIWAREAREREETERIERERLAKIWKQQQEQRAEQEREAAETRRQQEVEKRAAEQKRREEQARNWQRSMDEETKRYREQYPGLYDKLAGAGNNRQTAASDCRHDGWWSKVQGREACPECCVIWTYLLQCPSCKMKACPKCQSAIRPKVTRNAPRTNRRNRRAPPQTPTPEFDYYDY